MKEFRTVGKLVREGKLDRMLRIRLTVFAIVSILCGGAVFYDIVSYKLSPVLLLDFSSGSFLVGLLIFSKMNPVRWDEEREVVALKGLDIFGIAMIVAYVILRLSTKPFLDEYFKNAITVSGVTYASVFGIMLGRLFGILITIHKVHTRNNESFGK